MKKILYSLAAFSLVAALPATAQKAQWLPSDLHLTPAQKAHLASKLYNPLRALPATEAQKTAAGVEKLVANTVYDYTLPSGPQRNDSILLIYASNRVSGYDFNNLTYDYSNGGDYPGSDYMPSSPSINFDTMYSYGASLTSRNLVAVRTYNSANKALVFNRPAEPKVDYFKYDANGRCTASLNLDGTGGSGLDSSSRDFYFYDANGFLIRDSSEYYDAGSSAWVPTTNIIFTNNAAGKPTRQDVYLTLGAGITLKVAQLDLTYNGSGQVTVGVVKALTTMAGPLVNNQKDSFAYVGSQIVAQNQFRYDTTAKVWVLGYQQRRHLNSASLPDSVWSGTIALGTGSGDTTIQKLAYTSAGNPTYQRYYGADGKTVRQEDRYYYSITGASVPSVVKQDLSVFPNPASDQIRVSGLSSGSFSIANMSGQIVAKGTTQNGIVPVSGIVTGVYQLLFTDKEGITHTGQFIRQ